CCPSRATLGSPWRWPPCTMLVANAGALTDSARPCPTAASTTAPQTATIDPRKRIAIPPCPPRELPKWYRTGPAVQKGQSGSRVGGQGQSAGRAGGSARG